MLFGQGNSTCQAVFEPLPALHLQVEELYALDHDLLSSLRQAHIRFGYLLGALPCKASGHAWFCSPNDMLSLRTCRTHVDPVLSFDRTLHG